MAKKEHHLSEGSAMKKLFLILSLVFLLSTSAIADDFCDGWFDGYVAGFCQGVFQCPEPMVPMCPMPEIGEDSYQDGFARGFIAGHESAVRPY